MTTPPVRCEVNTVPTAGSYSNNYPLICCEVNQIPTVSTINSDSDTAHRSVSCTCNSDSNCEVHHVPTVLLNTPPDISTESARNCEVDKVLTVLFKSKVCVGVGVAVEGSPKKKPRKELEKIKTGVITLDPDCDHDYVKNYDGSSGAMESDGLLLLLHELYKKLQKKSIL